MENKINISYKDKQIKKITGTKIKNMIKLHENIFKFFIYF